MTVSTLISERPPFLEDCSFHQEIQKQKCQYPGKKKTSSHSLSFKMVSWQRLTHPHMKSMKNNNKTQVKNKGVIFASSGDQVSGVEGCWEASPSWDFDRNHSQALNLGGFLSKHGGI